MSSIDNVKNVKSKNKLLLSFIFHIGLYSFFGFDDLTYLRLRQNDKGSECYYGRLINFEPDRINYTMINHVKYGSGFDYYKAPFYITRDKIIEWLDMVVKCGGQSAIITAKHNDGFCLFNSRTTERKSKIDIVKLFKEECDKRNLIFGIYYSWIDDNESMTIDYFERICIPQLNELIAYNPKVINFDYDSGIKQKTIISYILKYINYFKENGISCNNKITNDLCYYADYFTVKELSNDLANCRNWQFLLPIGVSYGYNTKQREEHFKSAKQIYEIYEKVLSLGGTLMINIGPKHNGDFDERELQILNDFSSIVESL